MCITLACNSVVYLWVLRVDVLNSNSTLYASKSKSSWHSFFILEDGDTAMLIFQWGFRNPFGFTWSILKLVNNQVPRSC